MSDEIDNTPLILGLCADFANKYHGDVVLIRIVVLLLILFCGIVPGIFLYFAFTILKRKLKEDEEEYQQTLESIKKSIEMYKKKKDVDK